MSRRTGAVRTLAGMHGEATERLILESALRALERDGEITARAAAVEAGISERTVFRYFPSRDAFLAAAASCMAQVVHIPATPATLDELRAMPRALFTALDNHAQLVRAAWHSELRAYVIGTQGKQRWLAIGKLLDGAAPRASGHERKLAAATIRYHLSATTWHYHRFVFRFTLEETIEAAETVLEQQLAAILARPSRRPRQR